MSDLTVEKVRRELDAHTHPTTMLERLDVKAIARALTTEREAKKVRDRSSLHTSAKEKAKK